MLEKPQKPIENGQYRVISNIWHRTQCMKTININAKKKMNNANPTRKRGSTQMFSKSKISSCFLYNVRHSPCYSYSIFRYRVFSVIEKENIRTMEMIHYHVKNGYFVTIDQFMKTKKGSQMWTNKGQCQW